MTEQSPDFSELPEPLRSQTERQWRTCADNAAAEHLSLPSGTRLLRDLPVVWSCSRFVAQSLARRPTLLVELADGWLYRRYRAGELTAKVAVEVAAVRDEADLARRLRQLRQREMVRIAWRDIAAIADLDETLADLSTLAEACIDQALSVLYGWLCEQLGTPCNRQGVAQQLVVLGMGKLGGNELNFSSDIDLIFAYPDNGETLGQRRSLSNGEFFVRLGRQLIKALDAVTADGFVYRVDMRLRPHGSSGPLAIGFDAMEVYYQSQGRAWERYAMVKARVIAGDHAAGERLLRTLRPFVYRRYLDFSAIESLRELKKTIVAEVRRKGMEADIKLGQGGIREVEFVVQSHQIVHGGRDPELRQRHLLTALRLLGERGLLPAHSVLQLERAYRYLRRLENRIQQVDDRQTQRLPSDPVDQQRLLVGLAMDNWEQLLGQLDRHRRWVSEAFEQVFSAPQRDTVNDGQDSQLTGLWLTITEQDDGAASEALRTFGFQDPEAALHSLLGLRRNQRLRAMSSHGKERLDRLMPLAIAAAGHSENPDACLARLVRIIENIGRRSAYLALLIENPMALGQLVRLCASSAWIADQISRYPLLLDELIDPRTLFNPPDRGGLEAELDNLLGMLDPLDLEGQMEALRRFRVTNQLRVAAADIVGALSLMAVSDHLSWLAEVTLQAALRCAWSHTTARHGQPDCRVEGDSCTSGFAIIAYGKLGGLELGYGSDLDLVFLHAGKTGSVTDGPKPVDANVFFARLTQRIIHILSTPTAAGILYETDLRLRPSGASGLLVSAVEAFDRYQREQAWTWEHQALVRARPVAGDPAVSRAFLRIRNERLTDRRDPHKLRREVREMRSKMRAHLAGGEPNRFHLKQDAGGIADVEFLVQYGVLRWAAEQPSLLAWTDNHHLIHGFVRCGLLATGEAESLAEAYRVFRAELHRLTLQGDPPTLDATALPEQRTTVTRLWKEWLGGCPRTGQPTART